VTCVVSCIAWGVTLPSFARVTPVCAVAAWNRTRHLCSLLGLFPFTAPYLPWVMLGFSLFLGNGAVVIDMIGIVVGHFYFYLEDVYPVVAEARKWRIRRPLSTPKFMCVASARVQAVVALRALR
jgi:hypothetical protein